MDISQHPVNATDAAALQRGSDVVLGQALVLVLVLIISLTGSGYV